MRYITLIVSVMLLAMASCTTTKSDTRYDSGVSRELAEWRKATIEDVVYHLHFNIPDVRTEAVTANIDICFNLAAAQEVIIDFRDTQSIVSVTDSEGRSMAHTLRNEHIIVPAEAMMKGANQISISFTAGDQSLNRNDEYLYTLLVPERARTLFPCFDQPDMKASYELSLSLPEGWVAVSNTPCATSEGGDISFMPTEPLSTYLFSFVAGRLDSRTYDDGDHRFTAYYRETDPQRLAQLDNIFAQVAASIEWLEEYTGVAYPFAKYDFIMLPGFQYGGMEHTGATLYNDSQMFLGQTPTLDEELRRTQLIAHETAHMWFGDYVTMRWFDDVWTKEVFANYFAARMAEPLYPDVDHRLTRLKTYTTASLSEDRTPGTTSIRQELDNLQNAGLIYGKIIYNKAPIVMEMMVTLMGEEAFRSGIREYLATFAYGNATWPELIAILDKYTDEDLATFSDVWVHRKGMPMVSTAFEGTTLTITQEDSCGEDICRTQSFTCRAVCADGATHDIAVTIRSKNHTFALPEGVVALLPNADGRGYGLFIPDSRSMAWIVDNCATIDDEITREALIIALNECFEHGILDGKVWLRFILDMLRTEENYLIASTLNGYLAEAMLCHGTAEDEMTVWDIATTHDNTALRRHMIMTLAHVATSAAAVENIYGIWECESWEILDVAEYTTMAYELALRYPERCDEILATQRARITNADRVRQFDYISRAMTPDIAAQDELFAWLLEPENRRIEPWAATTLSYLNHHTRASSAQRHVYRGLEEIWEVQRTGDIFFPRNWAGALLEGHYHTDATAEVERFLTDNPDIHPLLRNKILQAAD